MKKILLFLSVLILSSCMKTSEQTIIVKISSIQIGSLTKVDPSGAFEATTPTAIPDLTLQSTSIPARKYTVSNGEAVTVPLDTYQVTGSYSPIQEGAVQGGSVYSRPPFSVSGEITVVTGRDTYSVPAIYDCFALVLDPDLTEKYRIRNTAGSMFDLPWVFGSSVKVAYIQATWTFPAMTLQSVPVDLANYETTSYGLVTDKSYEGFLVENGKWYCFTPNGVETNSGTIGIDFPQWEQGN